MPTGIVSQRELQLTLQDHLKRIRVLEANLGGGTAPGIRFDIHNSTDGLGNPADYLEVTTNGTGEQDGVPGTYAIEFVNATDNTTGGGIRLLNDNNAGIVLQNTGDSSVDGGIHLLTDAGGTIELIAIGSGANLLLKASDSDPHPSYGNIDFQTHGVDAAISFESNADFDVKADGNISIETSPFGVGGFVEIDAETLLGLVSHGGQVTVEANGGDLDLEATGGDVTMGTNSPGSNIILSSNGAPGLPAADPGVSGALWSNAGVVTISP